MLQGKQVHRNEWQVLQRAAWVVGGASGRGEVVVMGIPRIFYSIVQGSHIHRHVIQIQRKLSGYTDH